MKNRSLTGKISRWVLAFVSTLFLFALLVLGILRMTLFNQEFMIDATRQSDYTATITKEINESIQDLGRGSNIPADFLEGLVSEELAQTNLDSFIRGMYTDVPFRIQGSEDLYANIEERVINYANEMNYAVDETTQSAVDRLVTGSTNNFEAYIEIPYIATFGKNVMAYSQTLNVMTIFCGALFLLSLFGTFGLVKRWWHRRLRYVAYIFGGTGLMLAVLPGLAYLSRVVDRLSINTESLYRFLTTYVNNFILTFVQWGIICLIFALIMWGLSEFLRKSAKSEGVI